MAKLYFPFQVMNPVGTKLKRRMFFISVFGVTALDEYVILKVTQDTSVYDAISQVRRVYVLGDMLSISYPFITVTY